MSLSQLHYFLVVAEEGNLRKAAEKLRIRQPPLTRQMKALEEELGVELFERHARGVRLRPAGQALLVHVRSVFAAVDGVREAVQPYRVERDA